MKKIEYYIGMFDTKTKAKRLVNKKPMTKEECMELMDQGIIYESIHEVPILIENPVNVGGVNNE